jgi:predicted Zn-dependent protease
MCSSYFQGLETEADRVGMGLMVRAGYDPNEAIRLLRHLEKEPLLFGALPGLRTRIEDYRNLLHSPYQGKNRGIKNSEIFLSQIDKLFLDNAWLDLKVGRFDVAEQGARKYLKIRPKDARAYYLLGEIWRQRGNKEDTKKAKGFYQRAMFLDPSDPDPQKALGLICFKEGEKEMAKRFFESCLLLSPQAPDKAYIQSYLKQCNQ